MANEQELSRFISRQEIAICLVFVGLSLYVGSYVKPTFVEQKITLACKKSNAKELQCLWKKKWFTLQPSQVFQTKQARTLYFLQKKDVISRVERKRHWGFWSFLPALAAVLLCWLTQRPGTALFGGVVTGIFLLGSHEIVTNVVKPVFSMKGAGGILLLYFFLLGSLLGVWSKTGAAKAFAKWMTKRFVRGPKSAKLVAWSLGILFFQGGTISSVLVGTTVKPLADEEGVSHEELAYIVDSTSSPIASQIAFNAWPGYVQSFIFVAGVGFLATEADRIAFFFKSVPFCFYAIFAVLGTFLLSIEKAPFLGKRMREAMKRSRETGKLDRDGSQPLTAKALEEDHVPDCYKASPIEFLLPLLTLILIAVCTFVAFGSPEIRWAFGGALVLAVVMALMKGMKGIDLLKGIGTGMKSSVLGALILVLALSLGLISKQAGGGIYLVELLGGKVPFWALPVLLQIMTIAIAFSTGTSWGTYAVAFPIAMPLAWSVAGQEQLSNSMFYMTICFAAVMDGSVYGDQCSPISDTTVLSAMSTGCDLMDHVKSQIPQATVAAVLASIGWTICALMCA